MVRNLPSDNNQRAYVHLTLHDYIGKTNYDKTNERLLYMNSIATEMQQHVVTSHLSKHPTIDVSPVTNRY